MFIRLGHFHPLARHYSHTPAKNEIGNSSIANLDCPASVSITSSMAEEAVEVEAAAGVAEVAGSAIRDGGDDGGDG